MNKKGDKTVCFLIESPFPFYAGGIENWLFNVSKRLSKDCRVVILSEEPYYFKEKAYELPDAVIVCNYKTIRKYKVVRLLMHFSLFYYFLVKLQVKNMKDSLSEVIEKYSVGNVIALNTMNAAKASVGIKERFPNILYICSSRGPHAQVISKQIPMLSKYLHHEEIRNMKGADIVWTNGYDMKAYYESYGIRSILMKNGVDIRRFSGKTNSPYKPCEKVIVSVATLIDIKCISELIEAFAVIVNQRNVSNYTLYFVGKGNQTKYKQIAESLNVLDKVVFVGHKSDVRPYLKHADIIACLSGGGGFSMSALESMASGVPIIAWDTPVYRQFCLHTKTMELIKEKDVSDLADGLFRIVSNPHDYSSMSENALKEVNGFDWHIIIDEIKDSLK